MIIKLKKSEEEIISKLRELKNLAGSHSPSISSIIKHLPQVKVKIDACFLSNPYATDLFFEYLKRDLIETGDIRPVLESYPSQNRVIAGYLSKLINVDEENIFVGNGATEIIQAVMHRFVCGKVVVNIPTFSPYYEFANADTKVVFYQLDKKDDYCIVPEKYLDFVKREKPDGVVIINPNNPNGGYLKFEELKYIVSNLQDVSNIIIDESFVHFAFEDEDYSPVSAIDIFKEFPNVIVVKSMSKDFGIAGIRAGYAVMDRHKVSSLLKNGYLWNINGLAEYFFSLFERSDFLRDYENIRKRYISETQQFFSALSQIRGIKVYPSMANFVLVELLDGIKSDDFVFSLLVKYGIYFRTCSDKKGLEGEFVRISSRKKEENEVILQVMNSIYECT